MVSLLTEKILLLSGPEFHDNNFRLLRNTLKSNAYPRNLMEEIINKTTSKTKIKIPNMERRSTTNQLPQHGITQEKQTVAIPYVKGLFENLKSMCKDECVVVGKGDNNLKKFCFSRLKDKTIKLQQSNVVYKITCSCNSIYIGQTKQKLSKRTYQHKYNTGIKNIDHSAITEHAVSLNHVPRWDEVEILEYEYNKKKRLILEMIHIRKNPTCINKQKESVMLSTVYNNII